MVTQTPQFQAFLVVTGNQPKANADRFGLGLVMVEPPAVSLSLGHPFPPRLSIPVPKTGREEDGESAKRYPFPPAPAGPVGSVPGSPVCRAVQALARTPAATAALESKLDPFGRSRDCQSLPGQTVIQDDSTANVSWPSVAVTAATAAKK